MKFDFPPDLPISLRHAELLSTLQQHQVVIIAGETGSGKTTQLPKICLQAGWGERGMVGCTQPRRVAAMSLSRRVAEELQVPWGREVGCKMRFNDDTSRETKLKFMTDGILLAEIQSDPLLRNYSGLILDEAHERSLNIDFLLGYLVGLVRKRPDLKIIVTSATIDTQAFSAAFGGAPIVEVSGRMYPVELRYWPLEDANTEDAHYVEGAVRAVEDCLAEDTDGDFLVFMPTERDIRDTRDMLEGSLGSKYEVLPLFGRLSGADQQRVFSPGSKRRIVIATNIAETSLTIPRIRYVIDTGLARMSRYNPRTRTKRLPVEPVSQSSANQRQGRAGRVQDGICVRLYSQEDFEKRPKFTMPEIQRANLAEVILRMKAFRLGEIESFPFLNPPVTAAIRAGYTLLHELGALDEMNALTPLGRELARLPVDPTLGRMLLQARQERSLPEMLIIAAGLSIPDPRERPEEAREAANNAHKAFAHPDSDFLALLKLWMASPQSGASRNALRKFCQQNFLSLTRMKEWRDILGQLREMVGEDEGIGEPKFPDDEVAYRGIHRAILAGLPSHVCEKEEKNLYKTSGSRKVSVFPGSHLFEKRDKNKQGGPGKPKAAEKSKQPQWLVAGEIVQTSQLFARSLARIDPGWAVEVAPHLCEFRYKDPHWDEKAGRVLVWERVMLYGLELRRQRVDYGKIDPVKATEIFIREHLLAPEQDLPHRFFQHNKKLRHKLETALASVRSRRVYDISEALYEFYSLHLKQISSVHDFARVLREHLTKDQEFLCASEADLTGGREVIWDAEAFPDKVKLENTVIPLAYSYTPGQENDGVTVKVPIPTAAHLTSGQILWIVPGLRSELIGHLLRELPKSLRRELLPLEPKIGEIVEEFSPSRGDFFVELAQHLRRKYRLDVTAASWGPDCLPPHLQPRISVVDAQDKEVLAARNLQEIRKLAETKDIRSHAWDMATALWEKYHLTTWVCGDLPASIEVEKIAGASHLAYPGLALRDGEVDVRLFRKPQEVEQQSPAAIRKLGELALAKDLAWLRRELQSFKPPVGGGSVTAAPKKSAAGSFTSALQQWTAQQPADSPVVWCSAPKLQETAVEHLCRHLLKLEPLLPLTQSRFSAMVESARKSLPTALQRVRDVSRQIFELREQLLTAPKTYPTLRQDLDRLVPGDFLAKTPHLQLPHLVRYLKAMQVRAQRADLQPAKDQEKAARLAPFKNWRQEVPAHNAAAFQWLLEEYRVSIFAPELGTAQPVSEKRLLALMEEE